MAKIQTISGLFAHTCEQVTNSRGGTFSPRRRGFTRRMILTTSF